MAIDVEILLQKADVGAVLNKLGIDFERKHAKRGIELYFTCPTGNHPDDSNNKRCSVAESGKFKGHHNCWACDFRGNLIHLVRFIRKCSFKDALDFLGEDYGSAEVAGIEGLNFRLRMSKPKIIVAKEMPTFELPEDYVPIHQDQTSLGHAARTWLQEERHISLEAMEQFEVGVSKKGELPGTKGAIGPSVVVPVKFKRKIHSVFMAQPFKGGQKRYPKNSPQGEIFFNYDACLSNHEYIMVESLLDVITIKSVTGKNAMACFTNMISDSQRALLRNFHIHGVMPDLDGHRGWDLVDRMVPHTGKSLWLYFPPIGKDPGDCTPLELVSAIQWRKRYCDYETAQKHVTSQTHMHKITSVNKK